MLRGVYIVGAVVGYLFFGSGCLSLKESGNKLFSVKEAYYQFWVVRDNEKGTNIVLELRRVKKGVTFDSIVFRGVRMKAFTEEKNKTVELKSILPVGKSRIINLEVQPVNLPDQLIYHYRGKRLSYPLKMIERKEPRIY